MRDIIKRLKETEFDIDACELNEQQLLSLLDDKEVAEFRELVQSGESVESGNPSRDPLSKYESRNPSENLEDLIIVWNPWWRQKAKEVFIVEWIPFQELTQVSPNPKIINNILEVCYCYTSLWILFNGNPNLEIFDVCLTLKSSQEFSDPLQVIQTVDSSLLSRNLYINETYHDLCLIFRDCDCIQRALNEVLRIAIKKKIRRKLEFYGSWIKYACPDTTDICRIIEAKYIQR